ncbi:MAG: AAA family ATPase [Deltaproteobacteria bacterium]|nr:AAA family ATPase [Deltaproteobacteria bacterium]
MKKVALTEESFREIIQGDYLYIDKTRYILEMISRYKFCFLSRPRRFGKTLLIDTLHELFQGNRELFKGLWIDPENSKGEINHNPNVGSIKRSNYDFPRHPVIHLNMNYGRVTNPDELASLIVDDLQDYADLAQITLKSCNFSNIFKHLFKELSKQYNGARTVLLIDEYDAPVTSAIDDPILAQGACNVLHDFYSALKKNSKMIRFCAVTGITRFAKTALDSGPNMFKDISLTPYFAGICGFTVPEFDDVLTGIGAEILEGVKENNNINPTASVEELRKKILSYYDGYNWLGDSKILNPFSILNFLDENTFEFFWALSGRPSHLTKLIKQYPLDYLKPELGNFSVETLKQTGLESLEPAAILFHSGYLTIDKTESIAETIDGNLNEYKLFTLKIPNNEVERTYRKLCFGTFFDINASKLTSYGPKFISAFTLKSSTDLDECLNAMLAKVTYWQRIADEKYYHALFQMAMLATGVKVQSEIAGRTGRSDLIVELPDRRYVIIEIKRLPNADINFTEETLANSLDKALKQIDAADYAETLRMDRPTEIIGLAAVFYGKNIVRTKFWEGRDLTVPPNISSTIA